MNLGPHRKGSTTTIKNKACFQKGCYTVLRKYFATNIFRKLLATTVLDMSIWEHQTVQQSYHLISASSLIQGMSLNELDLKLCEEVSL